MRISLLLKREPFGRILEQTLSLFLRERFGKVFRVKWHDRIPPFRPYSRGQIWLCNPYLNAIFVSGVNRAALLPVIQEFSTSTVRWRRPVQGLYVKMGTHHSTSRFLARAHLEIDPPVDHPENVLILGGNHHIRFHDHSEKRAFVITKAGYDKALMSQDVNVRESCPYLPCPRILEKSNDGSWYSEDLILGTPVNRLQDQTKAWRVVRKIQEQISLLYKESARHENIEEYASKLHSKLHKQIVENPFLDASQRHAVLEVIKELVGLISNNHKLIKVMTVQSHGDFQPANILAGKKDCWLIDWEYTARKQAAYDALVYVLSARFPQGLNSRIGDALYDRLGNHEEAFLLNTPFIKWADAETRIPQIALFLLEDVSLKIGENANPMFKKLDQGFLVFLDEMEKALDVLHVK